MPNRPRIIKNLIIISARLCLIAKKVNLLKRRPLRHVPQAVRFVPPAREHIKTNLTPNAVRQVHVSELLLQHVNHRLSHLMFLVVLRKCISLSPATLSPNRTHIHHPVPELNESATFEWKLEIAQVSQDKVQEGLQRWIAQVLNDVHLSHFDALLDLDQPIFGKDVIKFTQDSVSVELLEHFLQVTAADDADCGTWFDVGVEELLEIRLDNRSRWAVKKRGC